MKNTSITTGERKSIFSVAQFFKIVSLLLLAPLAVSCKKDKILDLNKSDDGLWGSIDAGTWQLTSATYFNVNSNATKRYVGTTADSVLFMWGYDQYWNVVPTGASSFVGGSNRLVAYRVATDNFPTHRTATILTSPGWKDGYSDTLFVTYYSDYYLVFNVKDSVHGGYEMDSLKRIHIGG
jgi:hypothetical protein